MGRTTIEILTCDRKSCGEEFQIRSEQGYSDIRNVDGIKYMKKRNGSGSSSSLMSLMLCPDCSVKFLEFMEK